MSIFLTLKPDFTEESIARYHTKRVIFLLRMYWFALLSTLLIWGLSLQIGGIETLFTVVVLTLLEITFSADNAVINSKILEGISRLWQQLFMTVGILIAVFAVRFALPIFIVMFSAHLGFSQVIDLATNHPEQYAEHLDKATPIISAFGGSFLLLIALSYFIDYQKKTHWLGWLEKRLGKLGEVDGITTFIMLLASISLYATVEDSQKATILLAAICAMALHNGLTMLDALFAKNNKHTRAVKTGWAGFIAFLYLQVLDASFSLDGVIGAFALTNSVLIIMAGLGAGAVWVRAMTVHLVRINALKQYTYLEQGAHWAIAFLGSVMLMKLYHIELPQWIVGSLGLLFISAAVVASRQRRQN